MQTQTNIIITLQVEGFHSFPDSVKFFGEAVDFLAIKHRHLFYVVAKVRVMHDERDLEFLLLKREMQDYFKRNFGEPAEFGARSCETIARNLLEAYNCEYVSIKEDNENGAEIFKV